MTYNYTLKITASEDIKIQVKDPGDALLVMKAMCDFHQIDNDDIDCYFDNDNILETAKGILWDEEENDPVGIIEIIRDDLLDPSDETNNNNN